MTQHITTRRVLGDGRCLFRALVRALDPMDESIPRHSNGAPISQEDSDAELVAADALRQAVCDLMTSNPTRLIIGTGTAESPAPMFDNTCMDAPTYINGMRRPGSYAGDTELFFVAALWRRGIRTWLWDTLGGRWISLTHGDEYNDHNPLEVVYNGVNHYNLRGDLLDVAGLGESSRPPKKKKTSHTETEEDVYCQ